uniref:S-adenosylmethionine-dependent methyltransferase domain-containing protein n=1 Tax=Mantoniella antarctica TaxID=81844 RepID=A0A7S0SED3_9CHLO
MLSLELGGKKRNSADDEEEGKGWSEETESGADGDDVDTEDEEAAAPADAHVKSASEEVTTYCYDAKTGERCPAPTGLTAVMEGGVKYAVDLERGHKTGFYVDQRDNRAMVRALAAGKNRVMDVCCYTGGFALNAALGGAKKVIGVDSSQPALDIATQNAALNGVSKSCSFVNAEAFRHLDACIEAGQAGTYDMIILDPPKLAPNAAAVPRAVPKYVGMNQRAMKLLRPGGLLVTCSCSGAITQRGLLTEVVSAAAASAGRRVTMLGAPRGAGGDQPLDPFYPEGNYLTVIVCRVA